MRYQCNINDFVSIFQDRGWTLNNDFLDCSLFYKDLLHLIKKGNVKLVKSITLTVTSQHDHINLSSLNNSTSYSDITRLKVQTTVSFLLNEHNFPPLSNVCHPFWSDVSGSCLFQCKTASNVKHLSVHANPANTSSVSKLMKSLNISNPVPVLQPNVMSVTPVLLVNSLNH